MKPVRSRHAEKRRIRRNRPAPEYLEQRVALTGILNGDFSISDPANPQFGYVLRGGARIADGQGILDEGSVLQSGISQTFTIAPGTEKLRFSVVGSGLLANGNAVPPDAFEVALLNATTMQPLVGPPVGLTDSDAFLNIQRTGEVYFGTGVTVPGASTSGQPATLNVPYIVTVDVSGIAAGTQALLSFDLIGFSPITSSMRIDDIVLLSAAPPLLTMRLDPTSDSGVAGDNVTKLTSVDFVGITDPNQNLLLDIDDDGFDDGQTTADATGQYRFQAVVLPEGVNQVRTQVTNPNGSATAATTVTIDSRRPTGVLVLPVPDSTVTQDAGYVEIQWTDLGDAGLDTSTFGITDVTISGVSVDSIENLGGGRIRYRYNTDGDVLPSGLITISRVADQVFDIAGNGNLDGTESFTVSTVVNRAPLALSDSYIVDEGTVLTVAAPGVLGNDSDPDADTLTALIVSQPSSGSLTLNANGSFSYTPNAGFVGTDSFSYRANDGSLDSGTATVTIQVQGTNSQPIATNDSFAIAQNTVLNVAAPGVLSNDSDPDGDALTTILVSQPSSGSLTLNANGSFTYTPNTGFVGTDSFTYRANDGSLNSGTATVTIQVQGTNSQPIVANDTYAIAQNNVLNVSAPGVLSNDSDPDGDALTAILVSQPASGSLTLNANGSFTYTPNAGFVGTDSFTYRANDGSLDSGTATVSLVVTAIQGKPVITDSNLSLATASIYEGGTATLSGQFLNPNPAAKHTLRIDWKDGKPIQTIELAAGIRTFGPITQVYADDDPTATPQDAKAILVTVTDEQGQTDSASVVLTVVNVAPVIDLQDTMSGTEGSPITIQAPTVSDPGVTDTFTYLWEVKNLAGNVVATATTSNLTFVPADDGTFTVRLTVTDDDTGVGTTTTTLVVSDVPPTLAIDGNESTITSENYELTLSASDPGADTIASWTIDWGDGTVETVSGNPDSAQHTYRLPGGITLPSLPESRFIDYLRRRRSLDPARFDHYHPWLGLVFRAEENTTVRLPNMRYFDVARQRRAISQERFDRHHPLLGYMLALEEVPTPAARQVTIKATATNEDGSFRSNEIQVTVQPSQQWWTELPARIASARTAVWQRLRRSRFISGN